MIIENYAQRKAWRAAPGSGVAIVGSYGNTHAVLAVNQTPTEIDALCRYGAEVYSMPEILAAEIDGKDWYSEDDSLPVVPLPKCAQRVRA